MFELQGHIMRGPRVTLRRKLHMQNVLGIPKASLRQSLNLVKSPDLKAFLMLVKSPSHIMFIASNVAFLVHLKFYSTMKKNERFDHLKLQAAELQNYESVISELDHEVEMVQNEINLVKARKEQGIRRSAPIDQVQSDKWRKYKTIQQDLLRDQEKLAKKFMVSRKVIASRLSEPENIALLFNEENVSSVADSRDEGAEDYEMDPDLRTYSSPILNTMMLLSNLIITTCLVDLNLRFSLYDKCLENINSQSKELFRPNLFQSMKPDNDKAEMIQGLTKLCSEFALGPKQAFQKMDPEKKSTIFREFQVSDSFTSRELQRYDMYLYKSGRWRNYDNSDTSKWIQGIQGPTFHHNVVDNKEYFARFQNLFTSFKRNKSELKHVNFVLKVAKVLASGGERIPSNAIFRDLLDKFGLAGLYNYQALVYEHLPSFKHRKDAWADGVLPYAFADFDMLHFQDLVEEDPALLSSLFQYHASRENASPIKALLKFLEPMKTRATARQSVLPPFMTKSSRSVLADSEKKIESRVLFDLRVIEDAIAACVVVKDYNSIDKLLNKLVFNLVETSKGVKIVSGAELASDKFVLDSIPSEKIIGKLFRERLLRTLGHAYVEDYDIRRCEWIAPLIQGYINESGNMELSPLYSQIVKILESTSAPEISPDVQAPMFKPARWHRRPLLTENQSIREASFSTA